MALYLGTGRHVKKGDPEPDPPAEDVIRVYHMKFCPFSQRLKLVLHAKGIDHENVNINIKNKPDWMKEKNPREKVPFMELNGKVLYESDIIARYLDECHGNDRKLSTSDPWRRAEEHMLMGDLDKSIQGFYGLACSKDDEEKKRQNCEKIQTGFASLEKHLAKYKQPFIGGDVPGITDYMFWPFLERMKMLMNHVIQRHATALRYYELMSSDASVIACRLPDDIHRKFIETYKTGNPAFDYDVDSTALQVVTMCKVENP